MEKEDEQTKPIKTPSIKKIIDCPRCKAKIEVEFEIDLDMIMPALARVSLPMDSSKISEEILKDKDK